MLLSLQNKITLLMHDYLSSWSMRAPSQILRQANAQQVSLLIVPCLFLVLSQISLLWLKHKNLGWHSSVVFAEKVVFHMRPEIKIPSFLRLRSGNFGVISKTLREFTVMYWQIYNPSSTPQWITWSWHLYVWENLQCTNRLITFLQYKNDITYNLKNNKNGCQALSGHSKRDMFRTRPHLRFIEQKYKRPGVIYCHGLRNSL